MPKTSVIQVRIDAESKEAAEQLFSTMGTSLSEAVRMFVRQCLTEQRIPFVVSAATKPGKGHAFGSLSEYASTTLRSKERNAWIKSLTKVPDYFIGEVGENTNYEADREYGKR